VPQCAAIQEKATMSRTVRAIAFRAACTAIVAGITLFGSTAVPAQPPGKGMARCARWRRRSSTNRKGYRGV
jgi:hypothetical protein